MNTLLIIIALLLLVVIVSILLVMYSRKQDTNNVAKKLIQDIQDLPMELQNPNVRQEQYTTLVNDDDDNDETENFGMYTGALQTWLDNHAPIKQPDTKFINTINSNFQPNLEGFNENIRFQTPCNFEIQKNPTKMSQIKR